MVAFVLSSGDRAIVEDWARNRAETVEVTLFKNADKRSGHLEAFLDALSALTPHFAVKKKKSEEPDAPFIGIGSAIKYQAVPSGKGLAPFLEAAAGGSSLVSSLAPSVCESLAALNAPGAFTVYMAPSCPHCPRIVERVLALALAGRNLYVSVVDAMLFGEKAEADKVKSAPTVILDNHFRWSGQVEAAEMVDALVHRDPSRVSARALTSMLHDGEAPAVATMMQENNAVFPSFLELLVHQDWSIRLGAMVAFEYLAGIAPELAGQAAASLLERFSLLDATIQGDILHVAGESGNQALVSRLVLLAQDSALPEAVRESAREALEKLE
ncbi:MAG: thioredoxin family protein [Desulfatibacillaceae bacterium]|nr:thioredoxin family protein [Desulfatibacillaceae bacterium]